MLAFDIKVVFCFTAYGTCKRGHCMYYVDLLESVLYEGLGDGVEDDQQYTPEQLESVSL